MEQESDDCDSNANECKELEAMKPSQSYLLLGSMGEPLIDPCCVSVSPTGRYAVTDSESCMVLVYTKLGEYSHHFSTLPKKMFSIYWNLAEHKPKSVAWMSDERLVYSQPEGGAVIICHGNGQRCAVIKGRPLYKPYGVAVNSLDQILVVDQVKGRVLCYDQSGRLLRMFGGFGAVEGELTMPQYVSVGPEDSIFVNNYPSGRSQNLILINRYSNKGVVTGSYLTSINPDNEMGSLAVDDQGSIFQLDVKGHQVIQVTGQETNSETESENNSTITCSHVEEVIPLDDMSQLVFVNIGRANELVCIDKAAMRLKVYLQTQNNLSLENGASRRYMTDSREILNEDFETSL